jgi:hypothetical protein
MKFTQNLNGKLLWHERQKKMKNEKTLVANCVITITVENIYAFYYFQ